MRRLQFLDSLRLRHQRAVRQFGGDRPGQILHYKAVDDLPLVVQDAVNAEVQVGLVKLEKVAQQLLKLDL